MPNITISISIPEVLVALIDSVKEDRTDPTRSDTIRVLLLQSLATMNYLSIQQLKALGLSSKTRSPSQSEIADKQNVMTFQ